MDKPMADGGTEDRGTDRLIGKRIRVIDIRKDNRMDKRTGGRMDGCTHKWMSKQMGGQLKKRMGVQRDQVHGCTLCGRTGKEELLFRI